MARRDANALVECNCGHKAVIDAAKLNRWYLLHNFNTALETVCSHLRCSKCRKRPSRVSPTSAPPDYSGWLTDRRIEKYIESERQRRQ